jgi:hypothetical protein
MRITIAACLLALTAACDRPDTLTSTTHALDGLDVVELERAAAKPWLEHDDESKLTETFLLQALTAGYSADPASADGQTTIVRTALVEWAARVRHELGDDLHTAVPALSEDPECAGSMIGDHDLIDYVDAVTRQEPRERDVITALDRLSRHLGCLGEVQSMRLAEAMTSGFTDVRFGLERNQLAETIPYVVQATSVPMLLVHEIERRRGEDAPLSRWFAEYADLLREGAVLRHHPSSWHGLWLYDRSTGRLHGFRVADKAEDNNAVDLAAFFEFVAHPKPYDVRCGFSEVVRRGTSDGNYLCQAAACARGELDAATCENKVDGGGGGDSNSDGFSIPGLAMSETMACVTAQSISPNEKQLSCVSEATGFASKPLGAATKEMQQVGMAGAKVGGNCDLMDQAWRDYERRNARAQASYEYTVQTYTDMLTNEIEKLKPLQAANNIELDKDPTSSEAAATQAAVDAQEEAIAKAAALLAEKTAAAAAKREADRKAALEALRKAQAAASTGSGAGSDSGSGAGSDSDDDRCVEGSDRCGNGCSAITAQIQAVLDCAMAETTPESRNPLRGCGLACDPVDPEKPDSGMLCLETLAKNPTSTVSAACWSVRCGPSSASSDTRGCCGSDGKTTLGEPQLPSLCQQAHCENGAATYVAGRCTCGGGTGGGVPGGPLLTPMFP